MHSFTGAIYLLTLARPPFFPRVCFASQLAVHNVDAAKGRLGILYVSLRQDKPYLTGPSTY